METLFFTLSKVFWTIARPESWIVFLFGLAAVALWRGRFRTVKNILWVGIFLTLVIGTVPIGEALLRPLETRFASQPDVSNPAGIIILGGGEDARVMSVTGLPEVNDAADRFLAGLALARVYPEARLIFTGGSGSLLGQSYSGADVARKLFENAGIAPDRIVLEPNSRNTAENAALTFELIGKPPEGPWLLVTSAFHMPRAIGSFCHAGWSDIVPFPVDYRGIGSVELRWDLAERLRTFNIAIKEWVGLVAYRVTGRMHALFPRSC
jgi:uncharacterized SAM-binding protein YcdF (DUF218 family)